MEWSVVERFVEGKTSSAACEDVIVVSEHYFAVIDGATDETGAQFAGLSGRRFAAEVLAAEIAVLPTSIRSREFADRLTAALSTAVEMEHGPLDDDVRWPVASVVCFAPTRREIWRVGDCNFAIDGRVRAGRMAVDEAAYGFRAVINAALLARGMSLEQVITDDPGAEASRPLYALQQQLANVVGPWGYGCINGRHVPDDFIEVAFVPENSTLIVLASDGYPELATDLAESEKLLAALMESDPAAVGPMSRMGKPARRGLNAPDDRAYLRIAATAISAHGRS